MQEVQILRFKLFQVPFTLRLQHSLSSDKCSSQLTSALEIQHHVRQDVKTRIFCS